jgi:hypothetical protein
MLDVPDWLCGYIAETNEHLVAESDRGIRALNARIATIIMGWTDVYWDQDVGDFWGIEPGEDPVGAGTYVPNYWTDQDDALGVLLELHAQGVKYTLSGHDIWHRCRLVRGQTVAQAERTVLSQAICQAALMLYEYET